MNASQRKEIAKEYVRARLRRETASKRGVAAEIARRTRLSTAHLSNVTSEPPTRTIGEDMLDKMAEYWGFPSYSDLEAAALETYARGELAAPSEAEPRHTDDPILTRAVLTDALQKLKVPAPVIDYLRSIQLDADPGLDFFLNAIALAIRQHALGLPLGDQAARKSAGAGVRSEGAPQPVTPRRREPHVDESGVMRGHRALSAKADAIERRRNKS